MKLAPILPFRRYQFSGFYVLLAATLLGMGLGSARIASAAGIVVTTAADTIDAAANCTSVALASLPGPGGQTSLREAVCAANSNPGADTITFAVNGTYALTGAANEDNGGAGDLDIKDGLIIQGNGAANTILDGSAIERIFDVFPAAAITFALSNLTVQNGDTRTASFKEGGAMYLHNNVTTTISGCTITNSFSGANGAIENRGTLTINNSVISNNQTIPASGSVVGGGIRNAGALTIDNTTISNNSVRGEGGGIATTTSAGVVVNITKSTISGNTASVTGGGLGNGGGIATTGNQGAINITNSTISGNRADNNGGGVFFVTPGGGTGSAVLNNVTISNNTADNDNNASGEGGGLAQNTAAVTLRNTIIADNFNSTAATRDDISGAVVAPSANSLVGDGTGSSGITNGVNSNLVGSGASPVNPLLGALANNGGSTATHALQAGSPAINTGNNATCAATDQRGVARPAGSVCDIGAYEFSDTTPPDTTITGNPSNPSASANATFAFTGSDTGGSGVASFECQLDGGGFSACTSPKTYTGLADGSHTFQVRAKDTAGNADPTPASYTWVVDTTAPPAPVVMLPANGAVTNDNTPTTAGTAEASSTVTVYFDGSSAGTTSADGSGNWSFTAVTALSDGSHTVKATSTDSTLNTSVNSNTNTFMVDTTAPDTTITANPPNPSSSANASFSFTGNDASGSGVAGFECQLDGGGFSACTSPKTYTGLADGSHTFQVRAKDAAGNVDPTPASYTWVVDTTAPPAPVVMLPANGAVTNDNTPTTAGTAEASSTVTVYFDGSSAGTTSADGSGNWSFTAVTALSDGGHTVKATSTDSNGNTSVNSNTNTFTVDTTAPDTTITSTPSNPSNSAAATFAFTGSDIGGSGVASFECQLDGGGFSACTSPKTYTGLADGSHTFQVRAKDAAGNVDPTPASYTWVVDTTAPPAPVVMLPANGAVTNDNTPTTAGTAEASSTVTVYFDGSSAGTTSADGSGNWSFTAVSALSDGSHTVNATSTDSTLNTSVNSNTNTFMVDTTAPDTTITANPPNPSSSTNASFSFTGNDASGSGVAGFECQLDGGGFSVCTSPQDYPDLPVGAHVFTVRATDQVGNVDLSPAFFAWRLLGPSMGGAWNNTFLIQQH